MAETNYESWRREELIREIKKLRKRKKYGLVWEEKPEEVVDQCKTQLPVLIEDKTRAIITDPHDQTNILIEGDNYHALSVLNYTHKGKIDVIYIDPPYNTGQKDFKYNDQWVDAEDSFKHSKWLSFMAERLRLAKNLLSPTGVILISIDDNEQAQLKMLCDDLFGGQNFITNIIWQSKTGSSDATTIDTITEYMLVYAKNKASATFSQNTEAYQLKRYRCKDEFLVERGPFYPDTLDRGGLRYHDSLNYPITCPDGNITYPNGRTRFERDGWNWKWGKKKVEWGKKSGFILFRKSKTKKSGWVVLYKNYLLVDNEGKKMQRSAPFKNVISDIKTGEGAKTIKSMFGHHVFKYSKPVALIIRVLKMLNIPSEGVILDFMAGSGTTGHAVLELNQRENQHRRFILATNNEGNICTRVCYPRIKKVIQGYASAKNKKISGFGGNLRYFKTAFVDSTQTDKNKFKLTQRATEMLCVKESTFELVIDNDRFKIFKNTSHYTGIIWNQTAIDEFKQAIKNVDGNFSVYVFSLSDESFEEEFEDVSQPITLSPIPASILRVYRRIFN